MATKKTSASDKLHYGTYKSEARYAKNKVAKLTRHLKQYSDDAIAAQALKTASTATSSRWGTKNVKSTRTHLDRITDPLYANARSANRVYATVRDGEALILNGVLFTSEKLKEAFGLKATEKRADKAPQKSKVRRGKRKSA